MTTIQAIKTIEYLKTFARKDAVMGIYDAQEMISILESYEDEIFKILKEI